MNFNLSAETQTDSVATALEAADCELSLAEAEALEEGVEGLDAVSSAAALVETASGLAATVAAPTDTVLVTVEGHETLEGEGFRPAHATITVSKVDPAA